MDTAHKEYYLSLPTVHSGQYDNLVLEDERCRIWVSRCEDGADGKPLVTVEHLIAGKWETIDNL